MKTFEVLLRNSDIHDWYEKSFFVVTNDIEKRKAEIESILHDNEYIHSVKEVTP